MATLQVVTTSRGRQAVLDADIQGLKLRITHVAAGSAGYQPSVSATALRSEFVRAPIAKAEVNEDRYQLNLSAAFTGEEEGWIREIGFFAEDGTLVWLWSSADTALGYKSAPTRFLVGLSLTVTDVPLGQIEIVDQGQPLDLAIEPAIAESATATAALAAAAADAALLGMRRDDEMSALVERVRRLEQIRTQDQIMTERTVTAAVGGQQALIDDLALASAAGSETLAEVLRAGGQSGLLAVRQYQYGGVAPWDRPITVGYSAANMHDHANIARTCGLAELAMIVNGWYFRTRHNDYPDVQPAQTGHGFLAVRELPLPSVPASISGAGSVTQQINAMRDLIRRAATADLTSAEAQHFRWDLAYAEVWWEVMSVSELVDDAFFSPRHQADDGSARTLLNTIQAVNATGAKLAAENNPLLPIAVREVRKGATVAVLRYRILTQTVGTLADRSVASMVEHVDDPVTRLRFGASGTPLTTAQLQATRRARYRLKTPDTLMQMVPGLDGAGAVLRESYLDQGVLKMIRGYGTADPLNAAYYSRLASLPGIDASGRTNFRRGFNDPTLWSALTSHPGVVGYERDGETYRASWAIPLELLLRTPLETWNPYGIPLQEDATGQPAVTGDGIETKPYDGYHPRSRYYLTPIELFAGAEVAADPADTSGGTVYVRDAGGTTRAVKASGMRIILPPVDDGSGGTVSLRTRYPVYPVYHEGSPTFVELAARLELGA